MMRAFFISTVVLSLIYVIAAVVIADSVSDARSEALWNSYSTYDDSSYDSYGSYDYSYEDYYAEAESGTRMGGIVSVFYMLISAAVFVLALMKIKTKTMKVISIIGLSLSGLFLLWGMLPVASPSGVSFDEIGAAFILAAVALLGLHIVGMIHAFKTST